MRTRSLALIWILLLRLCVRESLGAVLAGPIVSAVNGHAYYLLAPSGWIAAEAEARTMGGHLATIRNQAENDWILNTFEYWERQHHDLWIGLNDAAQEGVQEWSSGEVSLFRPPNSYDRTDANGDEDFVHLIRQDEAAGGVWNDYPEAGGRPCFGVVEVGPPEPVIQVSEVVLRWIGERGIIYQVQYRSDLTTNTWTNLGSPIAGAGMLEQADRVPSREPRRFYRIVLRP